MVIPGASYTPLLFIPTKRFSTTSIRPTPLRPPIVFKVCTISRALIFWPLTATGTPLSKVMTTSSCLSGSLLWADGHTEIDQFNAADIKFFQRSSFIADVQAVFVGGVWLARVALTGMSFCSQYSIMAVRPGKRSRNSLIRQGAITLIPGSSASAASWKRHWSLPLPVAP